MALKYRKLPIVIEAVQWTGDNLDEVREFCGKSFLGSFSDLSMELTIGALEGPHKASLMDYIIKGIAGEFYPCKSEIFKKTYAIIRGAY